MPNTSEIYYHAYEGGEEGERPPFVLIHGAGGTHLHWPSQVRRLPGCRVYALDLPGHGKSDGCGQQSIENYARSVIDWLEAVGLHSAIFTGHSMGAAVVLSLALDYPEHVLGLVLVSGAAHLQSIPGTLENAAHPTTFFNAVETIAGQAFSPSAPAELTELATRRMAEIRPTVLYGDFLASEAFDATQRLGEIQQPALVICGQDDRMTPIRQAQFLAAAMPAARLEVIPDAGHMVMLEQPQAVADALTRFISEMVY